METKSVQFNVKSIDAAGVFEGYAATWDQDLGGDIIRPGAFKKTLNDNGGDMPIFWRHTELIGRNMAAREDVKGLWVRGQINLDVQKGREAYALAKQGAVKGLSIGFLPIPDKTSYVAGNRVLGEVKLFEYSLEPIAMNPAAQILDIKARTADHDEAVAALRGAQRHLNDFYRKLIE